MLPKLEGYAAALLGTLDAADLTTVASDLVALEQTVLTRADLRGVLADTSIAGPVRGVIVRELLAGKVADTTSRLAVFAATMVPAQEVPRAIGELSQGAHHLVETGAIEQSNLGLLGARKRVGGFADAILEDLATDDFAAIEHELFTWARTIEENQGLRRLLVDRDASLDARLAVTDQLLSGRVSAATLALARYVIIGGRPRDVVGTLDFLVDHVAEARNWRVARVNSDRELNEQDQIDLARSLSALTGGSVELQIAEEPELLGGVLVEVGDLRLDATTRGRLSTLRDAVASGHFYESALKQND